VTTTRQAHEHPAEPSARSAERPRLTAGRPRLTAWRRRLTGERPRRGVTPGSLLALHDAGYCAVLERLGPGRVLDVGCGEGFESLRFAGEGRQVLGVDYASDAASAARGLARGSTATGADGRGSAFSVAQMDAVALGLAAGTFDAVCSSHLIEHFADPARHVAELARVTAAGGSAFFLTPNAPADFENPFHLHLFRPRDLASLLGSFFEEVWVGGVDADERVKADFAARRAKAARILRLDVFDLRHRIPRSWYVALYSRLLPLAYAIVARGQRRARSDGTNGGAPGGAPDGAPGGAPDGARGVTADGWYVTDAVDETTLVLFAVCRRPREQPCGQP